MPRRRRGCLAAPVLLLVSLTGCAAELTPGELVVPGALPAEIFRGDPGDELGAGVALDGGRLLVGAPGKGEVQRLTEGAASLGPVGLGRTVWWSEGQAWAARVSAGVYRVDEAEAEEAWATPNARVFAGGALGGEARVVASDGARVWLWDTQGALVAELEQPGIQRLALGAERVLMVACPTGGCRALAWWPEEGAVEDLGEAGPGGAIAEHGGQAWWGRPGLDDPSAAGDVCAEDGSCHLGIAGDHLGRSLCAGYAAGIHNTLAIPARLRLVPLDGGPVIALDRVAPDRPAALACDPERVAVGLPATGLHEPGEGAVMLIVREL